MLKLVVSLCLVAFAFGGTIPDDFPQRSSRIVGGTFATVGQFPYAASLRTTANVHFCGGTLFSERWIVSAAHCTAGRTGGNTLVILGTVSRTTGGTTYAISRIINHPNFVANTLANDVSILETVINIVFSANVAPAELGNTFIGGGVMTVASGWGQTSHPGTNSDGLLFVNLSTLTNVDCRSRFSVANAARVFDNTFCTFTRAGEGTCLGDSGGPVAVGNTVVGVISWGIACAQGNPDVHARMANHRAWILTASS